MKKLVVCLSILFSFIVFGLPHILAHGDTKDIDKKIDAGTARLEVSPLELTEGSQSPFRIELWDAHIEKAIPYANVWVRVSSHDKDAFSGFLAPSLQDGASSFTYFFDKAGQYTIDVRFYDLKNNIIGQTSYPIDVSKDDFKPFDYSTFIMPSIGLLVGLAVGYGLAMLFTSKRQ